MLSNRYFEYFYGGLKMAGEVLRLIVLAALAGALFFGIFVDMGKMANREEPVFTTAIITFAENQGFDQFTLALVVLLCLTAASICFMTREPTRR